VGARTLRAGRLSRQDGHTAGDGFRKEKRRPGPNMTIAKILLLRTETLELNSNDGRDSRRGLEVGRDT
jgi:hypothetical protein